MNIHLDNLVSFVERSFHCPPPPPPGVDLNLFPGNLTTWGANAAFVPVTLVGGTGLGAKLPLCASATIRSSTAATWRLYVLPSVSVYESVSLEVPLPELPELLMVKKPEASWRSAMVDPRRKGAGWRVRS